MINMKLPLNLVSRLKAARQQTSNASGSTSQRVLRQWAFILGSGLALITLAAAFAFWRFDHWSNLEENVANEEVGADFYDRTSIEAILKEFDDKAAATERLLDRSAALSTDTATSTE